ncbi:MAG TPA: efflux RND transporter periplasmic adaptor subunit [Arenicellales bacterium]|nr:efflux RND transporter periplasmic adaptor subunit [Arenicellales bacterium]
MRTPEPIAGVVNANELVDRLSDNTLRLCDCRFSLVNEHAGRESYQANHIPGATYVDLGRDLAGPITTASGRHPLPAAARWLQTLGKLGITRYSQVVAYDEGSGAMAALGELEKDLKRQRTLFQRKVVSESVVGSALAQRDQAHARLESIAARLVKQQAQVLSAKAQVDSRSGSLRERELDLGYTVILSPVDGVVINRDVDVGQTVAASLQAPVLFTLAKDLRDVQIEVSVDEADIGRVIDGQQVRFTVDAYPDRRFSGHVSQIRKAPQVDSGVVTYRVMVATRNNDEALLPGMTATVEIIVGRRENVLRVPNSALRFKPKGLSEASGSTAKNGHQRALARIEKLATTLELSDKQRPAVAAVFREMGEAIRALRESGMEEQARKSAKTQLRNQAFGRIEALLSEDQRIRYREMRAKSAGTRQRRGTLWRPQGPTSVRVEIGLSDDTYSEITSNELSAGDAVITGRERATH